MRAAILLMGSLTALISAGTANADSTYYNPANAASSSGLTSGYDLYRTIGCPGQGLLELDCKAAPAKSVQAPAAVEAPAPAPVVVAAPAPAVVQAAAPVPAPSQATPIVYPWMAYCPIPKQ